MQQRSYFLGLALFASAVAGCLDATPINLAKQSSFPVEGGVPEAGDDSGFAHPECRACIHASADPGPGCGDKIEVCQGTAACMGIYECAYANGCVTMLTQGESIACALPCAAKLGVTDVFDPSIQAALRLTECFHGACANACEIGAPATP